MKIIKRFKLPKIDSSDLFFICGAAAISVGMGLIYIPAGVIALGVFLILISISVSKTGRQG